MVRGLLIVCALTVLTQSNQAVAQLGGPTVSDDVASDSPIQVIAGETAGTTEPVDQFRQLLDRAIETTSKRTLVANSHSPWQIFHCILALRQDTVLRLGDQKVNAIEWLSTTEPEFDKQPWLLLTPHGAKFHPYTRMYAFEGHPSQFLALLSHSNLPMDYPFHVQGKVVTLLDLVNNTMQEVNTKEEVTWVLWALQHFLKPDAVWVNQHNETWSIERLVKIESEAPIVGTPCGGNHRLFALTRARDKYLAKGGQLRGVWFQADQKIKQHIEIARSLQNPDGSFSSEFYKGKGFTNDVNKRFNSTGHTMEFLSVALPKERLNEPWVRNAVWMLSRELIINRDTKIDCGPLFHSLDALILYRERLRAMEAPSIESPQPESMAKQEPPVAVEGELKLETVPKPLEAPTPAPLPKRTVQLPDDVKPGTSEQKSVPLPEPIEVPEVKLEQPQLTLPPQTKAPAKSTTDSVATKVKSTPAKTGIPKIDPSKLPNVGQVAVTRKTEPAKTARRDAGTMAPPSLLPESIATPLPASKGDDTGKQKPPIPVMLPDGLDLSSKLQPGALEPAQKTSATDCGSGISEQDEDLSVPLLMDVPSSDPDEPASALEPAKP